MKLDRYVASEVIVPATLGFVTYTFLLMMRGLFALIEQIFVRGLPVVEALSVLAVTLPHVVVLTIPMGYLFGVLLAAGRLSGDNEIVAIQASGISVRRLLRPILVLGVLLALLNGYLYLVVIPPICPQGPQGPPVHVGPKPGSDPTGGLLRAVSESPALRAKCRPGDH